MSGEKVHFGGGVPWAQENIPAPQRALSYRLTLLWYCQVVHTPKVAVVPRGSGVFKVNRSIYDE